MVTHNPHSPTATFHTSDPAEIKYSCPGCQSCITERLPL